VAVIVTVAGDGGNWGATYNPVSEIPPTVTLPPAMPFTVQMTAVLVVPSRVTTNRSVPATSRVVLLGVLRVNKMLIVTIEEADLVMSA
jgi:hypothetical protein